MTPRSAPCSTRRREASLPAPRWIAALLLLTAQVTEACRFNVRDVGFVDLEAEAYRLFLFSPAGGAGVGGGLHRDAEALLRDSPVILEFVPANASETHSAQDLRNKAGGGPETRALLGDVENLRTPLSLAGRGEGERPEDPLAWCRAALESPVRREILDGVRRAFGVILLMEGANEAANGKAREVIGESVTAIRAQIPSLPKKIAEPPVVVTVRAQDRERERVLLWALRQETAVPGEPRLAIVYGRGRWIGPVMVGEEIRTRNITGIFALIGADCECGLDLGWTQGTRLPLAWDERGRSELSRALGFDPDNPEIRSEISWIVSRRGSGERVRESAESSAAPSAEALAPQVKQAPGPKPPSTAQESSTRQEPARRLILVTGVGAGLVLAVGGWLLRRAAEKP